VGPRAGLGRCGKSRPQSVVGLAAVQLVEELSYRLEIHDFDSRWFHWNFSLTAFWPHSGPGVDSATNRSEYQEHFLGGRGGRCIGLSNLPPSCAGCVEIRELEPAGSHRVHPGLYRHVH
jgi:hypothetical protein